ncbi:MAG: lipase family protein [Pseudomonadota bacterium]
MTASYDAPTAQAMMTLASIAYTEGASDPTKPAAKDIAHNLSNTVYSTKGEWQLVWGPGYSTYDDNMMYVVQKGTQPIYAVVIRGTEPSSLKSWFEDVPTGMTDYATYTSELTRVSDKFAEAIEKLEQTAKDPGGQGFEAFFDGVCRTQGDVTIYVTGHSQGAGLAPIMGAWLHAKSDKWAADLTVISYGFAPPTSGDRLFAEWVDRTFACFYVANPNDIVPFAYNRIGDIIPNAVPTKVPEWIKVDGIDVNLHVIIDGANIAMKTIADFHMTSWEQAGAQHPVNGHHAPKKDKTYEAQVGYQHDHNTYLSLIGAYQPVSLKPAPTT